MFVFVFPVVVFLRHHSTKGLKRLQRQATAYDESCLPLGGSRRGSQPALSPDVDDVEGRARRDSLSPDSASKKVSHFYWTPTRSDHCSLVNKTFTLNDRFSLSARRDDEIQEPIYHQIEVVNVKVVHADEHVCGDNLPLLDVSIAKTTADIRNVSSKHKITFRNSTVTRF